MCMQAGVVPRDDDEIKEFSEPCDSNTFSDVTEATDVERLLPMQSGKRMRMMQMARHEEEEDESADKEDTEVVPALETTDLGAASSLVHCLGNRILSADTP
ncbi:hypothetical protein Ddye_023718 [Dipteronia dyeriana]|uniref:Uncharacterized protein n=1 Tax=Dipteronia dyeriana TaxID=168575 RepID=A0AAD9WTP0_9ROSI|nr:hypothetical protein Ddye_023718 [Dipteronia dyeriana]